MMRSFSLNGGVACRGFFGPNAQTLATRNKFFYGAPPLPRATTPVLSGSIVGGFPQLDWTASTIVGSTIDHYEVFREVDHVPPFTHLADVPDPTLTYTDNTADPTLHAYTYEVFAVPVVGQESHASNPVTIFNPPLNVTVHVTAADEPEMPFSGTWETEGIGYSSDGSPLGLLEPGGAIDTQAVGTHTVYAICDIVGGPPGQRGLMILFPGGSAQDIFESVTIGANTFLSADATYNTRADNGTAGATWATWLWETTPAGFVNGVETAVTFNNVIP